MSQTTARYAAVTSTLALVVALGGTSYAAVRIGTAQLKDGAVTSAKIKNGAVTGADVTESSLSLVPNADTAVRAQDATTVDGTRVVVVDTALGTGPGRPRFVFSSAGLDVEVRCLAEGGSTVTRLVATTGRSGADISSVVVADQGPPALGMRDVEDHAFDPSDAVDLLAGDDGDVAQVTFVYRDGTGSVVQGTLRTDVSPPDQAEPCVVSGVVLAR